jgi:hypothetical protein
LFFAVLNYPRNPSLQKKNFQISVRDSSKLFG